MALSRTSIGPGPRSPIQLDLDRDPSGFALVLARARWRAEAIGAREALGREPSGVGTIATPVGEFLAHERELASGRIGPGEAGLGLEGLQVRQAAVLVALQPD